MDQGFTIMPIASQRINTKAQENALLGGAFIVMSMGFYVAWSSYLGIFPNQWYWYGLTSNEITHTLISWHIAFIIGAAAGVVLVERWPKNLIYYGSAITIIISGALMIPSWSDMAPIIAARYIGGLAHGAVFLTIIIHASEISVPKFRGKIIGCISLYFATSLFIAYMLIGLMIYINSELFYADQLLAVLTIVYGVIALVLTRLSFIESPIYHIQNNDHGLGLATLAKLRHDNVNSWSVTNEFAELQSLVNEKRSESVVFFDQMNLKPLLRASLLRGTYAAATVIVFNIYAYLFLAIDLAQFGLGVVHTARFISEGAAIYLVDRIGRRLMLLVSTGLSAILLIIIAILLFGTIDYSTLIACGVLFTMFTFCLGFGLSPVSVIYLGESFTLKKKPYSILLVLTVEQIIHIIVFVIIKYSTTEPLALFLAVGSFTIGVTALMYLIAPETKGLNLKESKDKLR